MNGLLGDFGCVMADTDHHHSTGQPIALTGVCVETLLALARSPGTSSAQELVENIILPRTKGQGCGYAQTLAPTKRGRPTVYVSIAWEVRQQQHGNKRAELEALKIHACHVCRHR